MPTETLEIKVKFEEPDDPLDGVYHRLIIGAAAVAVTIILYIIFCVIGRKRGWFTRGNNPDAAAKGGKGTASEGKGYVYRERTSEVVRDSRPADSSVTNVYKNEQQ